MYWSDWSWGWENRFYCISDFRCYSGTGFIGTAEPVIRHRFGEFFFFLCSIYPLPLNDCSYCCLHKLGLASGAVILVGQNKLLPCLMHVVTFYFAKMKTSCIPKIIWRGIWQTIKWFDLSKTKQKENVLWKIMIKLSQIGQFAPSLSHTHIHTLKWISAWNKFEWLFTNF